MKFTFKLETVCSWGKERIKEMVFNLNRKMVKKDRIVWDIEKIEESIWDDRKRTSFKFRIM